MNFEYLMKIPLNEFYFEELSQHCNDRNVIPFVGAGFSYPIYPLWQSYIIQLVQDFSLDEVLVKEMLNKFQYEEATDYIYNQIKYRAFTDHIRANFGIKKLQGKLINGPVSYLPRIFIDTVITTNFDCVLETIYKRQGNEFETCVFPNQFVKISESIKEQHHYLIKIHGDVDGRSDIVLTKKQYDELYGDDTCGPKPFVSLLERYMLDKSLLFLGCSINNDRTISTLYDVTKKFKDICHYAILERPENNKDFIERTAFLSERGIRPIWFPYRHYECIEVLLKELAQRCENIAENNQANSLLRQLVCSGIEFTANEASINFDKMNGRYDFIFKKHFVVLIENLHWFKSQFYANKILNSYDDACNYYANHVINWEDLDVHAYISFRENANSQFTPYEELKIRNHSEKGNYIPFDILYETIAGKIIELSVGTNVIIKYQYSVPIEFWGSYINRSSTFFNERMALKFMHLGEVEFKIFELQNDINGLEGNLVEINPITYSIDKEFDSVTGVTTTSITLPRKRCGRWRIFWDAANYFYHDFNSVYGRDLLRQTTY